MYTHKGLLPPQAPFGVSVTHIHHVIRMSNGEANLQWKREVSGLIVKKHLCTLSVK